MINNETLNFIILVGASIATSIIISYILRKSLHIFITKYAKKLQADPTNFSFIKNSVGFFVYLGAIIFIFYKIPYLKSLGTGLFAGAGIITMFIGFASQKAFSNIIAGILILIFKPFKIKDIIKLNNGLKGGVEEITLRHTIIRDFENRRIIIPNSIISEETIINSDINDEKIRKHIVFSISYDSNIDKAIDIIREEALKHPLTIDNRSKNEVENNVPIVVIRVISLSDYSVDLKAYIWSANEDTAFVLECDLLKSVKQRFDEEDIEIPFPYRTIIHKQNL